MNADIKIKKYNTLIKKTEPKTMPFMSLLYAFLFGGLVCCIGQLITDLTNFIPGIDLETARTISTISLIGIAILLTGIGVFDEITRIAGSGTVIPITGFANSMAATAIEFKTEGMIFGLGTKMFLVAGPVIVNGVVWSFVAGIIRMIIACVVGG